MLRKNAFFLPTKIIVIFSEFSRWFTRTRRRTHKFRRFQLCVWAYARETHVVCSLPPADQWLVYVSSQAAPINAVHKKKVFFFAKKTINKKSTANFCAAFFTFLLALAAAKPDGDDDEPSQNNDYTIDNGAEQWMNIENVNADHDLGVKNNQNNQNSYGNHQRITLAKVIPQGLRRKLNNRNS